MQAIGVFSPRPPCIICIGAPSGSKHFLLPVNEASASPFLEQQCRFPPSLSSSARGEATWVRGIFLLGLSPAPHHPPTPNTHKCASPCSCFMCIFMYLSLPLIPQKQILLTGALFHKGETCSGHRFCSLTTFKTMCHSIIMKTAHVKSLQKNLLTSTRAEFEAHVEAFLCPPHGGGAT